MRKLESIASAAKKAVALVGLKRDEKVAVIYDIAASNIAQAIISQAQMVSPGMVRHYCMEDYGLRSDDGVNPLQFPDQIKYSLQEMDVSFMVRGQVKKGERESFTLPMFDAIKANERLRHAHMPGITEEVFLSGMSADYNQLRDFTKKVKDFVRNTERIMVTTPAGTDFVAKLSPKIRWIRSDGFIAPGRWGNIPGSETYTSPVSLQGVVVVDGVLGDYFDGKYGVLDKTPLTLHAEHGRVTGVFCPGNRLLEQDFKNYIRRDENSDRFGELGIGTNIGIEKLLGNMLHDEKFPGVHVAVGDPIGEKTGADWKSKQHCDMVMKKCNIFVDGKQIMFEGQFQRLLGSDYCE